MSCLFVMQMDLSACLLFPEKYNTKQQRRRRISNFASWNLTGVESSVALSLRKLAEARKNMAMFMLPSPLCVVSYRCFHAYVLRKIVGRGFFSLECSSGLILVGGQYHDYQFEDGRSDYRATIITVAVTSVNQTVEFHSTIQNTYNDSYHHNPITNLN